MKKDEILKAAVAFLKFLLTLLAGIATGTAIAMAPC